jgi:phospholipid/cholesterol/gamma-HCH transport system substrate-binding protein
MARSSVLASVQHRVLGVTFLALLALFGYLTYAIFSKSLVSYDDVTLQTDTAGLQLPDRADVKIRGVRVGEVTGARVSGDHVDLTLGLYPSQRDIIPENVSARIVPKTLFGEKYVALQVPSSPSPRSIQAGDTISESHVAIEVEKVLNDLYPLLRTVQPAQLNYTLTAMADALEGRGEKLGRNLVVLDDYLRRMNPKIPLLIDDLGKLATVSDTYAQVAPELARLLRNSVTTGNTFVQKEAKVQALFDDVASFSSTSRDFLEQNGSNIIRLSEQGQAQLPLFAKYAPEYPCLLNGMTDWVPRMESAYRGYTLHINLETLPNQPTGYSPADRPRYAAHNGPHCSELPHPPHSQANPGPQPAIHEVDDGVSGGHGKFRPRSAPGFGSAADSGFDMTSGYAGTASERTLVNAFAAPAMGVAQDDVPDLASLLLGPLARGAEVSVR